ncbi:hypothetical protein ACSV9I_02170 [Rhizobium sp. G187]|uniref:hypothetical protein n=1 Tax=Rhizobium sp. G187 TaxID=3451352 RepID=UPI003EE74D59
MDAIANAWGSLPPLAAGWAMKLFVLAFLFFVPVILYGQRLGRKAVDEGRARLCFGMVSNFTAMAEILRQAQSGSAVARLVIVVKLCLLLLLVVLLVWPKAPAV